jgi:exopolysaccharide biosynthesis polyprenyl glycosylphosphotransferase
VEPSSFQQEPSSAAGPYRPAKSRARPTPPPQRRIDDTTHLKLDAPAQVRLGLQRRAPRNLRRHVQRAVMRFAALLVADLAAFGLMRELIRTVRDTEALGAAVGAGFRSLVPAGYLNGWQYAAALFLGLLVLGNYGPGDRRRDPWRLFLACALATALPLWMLLWTRGFEPVLVQYSLTTILVWAGVVAERLTIDRVIARVRNPERDAADTVFVGPPEECRAAASSRAFGRGSEYRPIGFVDLQSPPSLGALGQIGDLPILLAASGAEVVVICGFLKDSQFRQVVDAALAGGCQVLSIPRAIDTAGVHPTTVWRRGEPLVQLTAPSLKGQQLFVKRVLDIVGAAAGLVLLSPVFALLATVVKLDSRGPVFFTQDRVGRGGRLFKIIKYRTMVDGAESHRDGLMAQSVYPDPRLFKVLSDPRTTKLGRWLRRTSLDELPQLVNVLRGEMSLVGPRPPLPSEVALYEKHHYARFDVKPGMTGPWQVAGRNEIADFEKVVALETAYIRNWSLFTDIAILVRTIPTVLRMRGAH